MCLNMQYQPNLTVEVFTPWKYQSGAVSELSTLFRVQELNGRSVDLSFNMFTLFFADCFLYLVQRNKLLSQK